jgi:hypothetical protein
MVKVLMFAQISAWRRGSKVPSWVKVWISWWMERASCNDAWRVRMGEAVGSFSVGMKGIASEGEKEWDGGSSTRDNAICRCTFLLSWLRWSEAGGLVEVEVRSGAKD